MVLPRQARENRRKNAQNKKAFCAGVADCDVRGREGALPEMPLGVFRGAEPVRAVLAVRTRE